MKLQAKINITNQEILDSKFAPSLLFLNQMLGQYNTSNIWVERKTLFENLQILEKTLNLDLEELSKSITYETK